MLVLLVLTAIYFLLLFPDQVFLYADKLITNVLEKNLLFIIAIVTVTLLIHQVIRFYSRKKKRISVQHTEQNINQVKLVDQIIWRNRYVLNAKKMQLLFEISEADIEKWEGEKLSFAQDHIYNLVDEVKVPYEIVSERIEKSLSNASIGGVRPPTYKVKAIDI